MLYIYNKISDYIVLLNCNGEIIFCNESFLKRLNYNKEDLLNLNIYEIINNKDNNIKDILIESDEIKKTLDFYSKSNELVKINSDITTEYYNNEKCIFIVGKEVDSKMYTTDLSKITSEELYKSLNRTIVESNFNDINYQNMDLSKILSNIGEGILDYTRADSLAILMYEKGREGLIPFVKLKNANKHYNNIGFIPMKMKDIYSNKYENYLNTIYSKTKLKDLSISKHICIDELDFIGNYEIKLSNKFIGIMTLSYSKGNAPKCNNDEYMKYICNKIAMLIKIVRLSNQVFVENKMRKYTEKELEQYLNVSVDLVSIVGKDDYFKRVSPNWHKVLGWTEKELLSMPIQYIVHPEDVERFKDEKNLNYEDVTRYFIRFRHKKGYYIHLEWSSMYISEQEIYVTAARDITGRLEIEKEKRKLEEAVQLEIVKNEFFSNMSHEFRTPINILIGTIQIINKKIEKNSIDMESLKKYTNYIKQNSHRLLRLINNLIDISKMDIGAYELRSSNQNIINIIEDITLSVADYTKNNKINLTFDTNIEELITSCDPDKIERIMLNLLSNAIKYTPENGHIYVDVSATQKDIFVSVKDSGIGIPKDKLDIIFDRFVQVDGSFNRKCEGSGIGLSLVKNLVEMHGGKVSVKSKVNEGSEFIFSIPIQIREENNKYYDFDRKYKHVERCDIEFSDIYNV